MHGNEFWKFASMHGHGCPKFPAMTGGGRKKITSMGGHPFLNVTPPPGIGLNRIALIRNTFLTDHWLERYVFSDWNKGQNQDHTRYLSVCQVKAEFSEIWSN